MIFVSPLALRRGDDWPYGSHSAYLYSDDPTNGAGELEWFREEYTSLNPDFARTEPFPHYEITRSIRETCLYFGAIEADVAHFAKTVQLWKNKTK